MANVAYYQVTDNWSVVMPPRDTDMFVVNLTGKTIKFNLSDNDQITDDITLHPFTIGGIIGQAKVPADKYLIAKSTGLPLSTVPSSNERIDIRAMTTTGDYVTESAFNELILKVMTLDERTRKMGIRHLDTVNFTKMIADELRDIDMRHTSMQSRLIRWFLNSREQMLEVQRFIAKYQERFKSIEEDLVKLETVTDNTERVDEMEAKMVRITSQMEILLQKMSNITEDTRADDLKREFASVNNALTTLVSKANAAEINDATIELLKKAPSEEMQDMIRSLRDLILRIQSNEAINAAQERELEFRVDEREFIFLRSPTLDDIEPVLDPALQPKIAVIGETTIDNSFLTE